MYRLRIETLYFLSKPSAMSFSHSTPSVPGLLSLSAFSFLSLSLFSNAATLQVKHEANFYSRIKLSILKNSTFK